MIKEYSPTYIQGIDGVRAFAVIAVMLFHIYPGALPGGFTGVDIFFVLSGYVVSSSLAKNYKPNFFKFTVDFYGRRIVRLIPILLIFLLISSLITTLFIPSSWLSESTSKTALASFFGYSNFALVWYNDGYFSPRIEFNPFVHTWSLSVEEQFYVLFPLVFFIWYRFKNSHAYIAYPVKYILAILLIISLSYSWYETSLKPENAFYLLPSRFWELAFGALLFKLHVHNKFIYTSELAHKIYLIIGFILINIGFFFADEKNFPFPWAIPSVIGTVFLIIGFINNVKDKSIIKSLFENQLIVYIGKISYSLYLWHWAIYAFFRWTIGLDTLLKMSVAVILTIIFSVVSYRYVEKPFRKNSFIHKQASWKIVLIGLLSILITYSIVKQIFDNQFIISQSVTKDKQLWYPEAYPQKHDKNFKYKQDFSKHKIFVLGDSHSVAYSTMLQKLAEDYNVKVLKFSSRECSVADFRSANVFKGPNCVKYVEDTLSKIEKMASPNDILFLASLRMNRLCDQFAVFSDKDVKKVVPVEQKIIYNEVEEIIRRFEDKNINVLIDAPKPVFKLPPFRCSDWFNQSNPICKAGFFMNRDYLLGYRKQVMDALDKLNDDNPKLVVWDPFPILCKSDNCSAFDGNKPLFFDGDHISGHANRVLYPSFSNIIEMIWSEKNETSLSSSIQTKEEVRFNSRKVIYSGWANMESGHRWSLGKSSKIIFRLSEKENISGTLTLNIASLGKQTINVKINNHYIGSKIVDSPDTTIIFKYDKNILNLDSSNIIEFEFPDAKKPDNSADSRILAIALMSFIIGS